MRKKKRKKNLINKKEYGGVYVYENRTNSDVLLPKPTDSGVSILSPNERFEGNNYYLDLVRPPISLLKLVQVKQQYKPENKERIKPMSEEKLILDQPDVITNEGKVEQIVSSPQQELNETEGQEEQKPDVLLNEGPIDGVEIILG